MIAVGIFILAPRLTRRVMANEMMIGVATSTDVAVQGWIE